MKQLLHFLCCVCVCRFHFAVVCVVVASMLRLTCCVFTFKLHVHRKLHRSFVVILCVCLRLRLIFARLQKGESRAFGWRRSFLVTIVTIFNQIQLANSFFDLRVLARLKLLPTARVGSTMSINSYLQISVEAFVK